MGLLDYLFDSGMYGDPQSGLLSRLSAMQGNYSSPGFPDQQAQPVPVGPGYQMPRVGSPDLYAPQQAPLNMPTDFSAQSRQPQQQPQQSQELPPAFGGGSYLDRLNNGGSLIGSLFGDTARQKNLSAQYESLRQALVTNGETPQAAASKAMVAMMNPEAAKTVIPELFTNKEELKIIKDEFGAEHPYTWNPREQTFKPLTAPAGGAATGSLTSSLANTIEAKRASGASVPDLLKEVPEQYRNYVSSVLEGKALPTNLGRGQLRAQIMNMAHMVDPSFDETLIPLRTKTASDYAPNGQSGRSIVALNTVQHHIGKLSDDLENMGDTGWSWINALRNGVAVNTPLDPKQGKAVQAVQDDIKAVTDEMSAAYKAGRVSDHEIEAWNKLASSNLPLRQLKQGIYDFVGLLNGKRDQLNETHQAILGKEAPAINKELNAVITKKVSDRNSGVAGASASKPQTVIQNGHTYNLQPDGSYK